MHRHYKKILFVPKLRIIVVRYENSMSEIKIVESQGATATYVVHLQIGM